MEFRKHCEATIKNKGNDGWREWGGKSGSSIEI